MGTVDPLYFSSTAFFGNLQNVHAREGPGTFVAINPGERNLVWVRE
jgi:hypothetical protein